MSMNMGTGIGMDMGMNIGNAVTTTPHTNMDTPNNTAADDTGMTLTSTTTMMDMPSSTTDLEKHQQQHYHIPVTATNQLSPPSTLQSMQLGNWFSGNRHMMGLLEEDLSQFDFDPSFLGVG